MKRRIASRLCLIALSSAIACTQPPSRPDAGPPRLAPNPSKLVFNTAVGTPQMQTLGIVNFGGASLTVTSATSDVPGLSVAQLPPALDIGAASSLSVQFNPPDAGTFMGTLTLASNASMPTLIPVSATATGGSVTLPRLAAFPEAQGGGAAAVGGRGGKVYEVNTLMDSDVGSLRACLEASMARTCVFTVAGVIDIGRINIGNGLVTVAGQTAPGQGITLHGTSETFGLFLTSNDIVLRYLTIRGDDATNLLEYANTSNGANVILDHVSVSWGYNFFSIVSNSGSPLGRLTVQHSLFTELGTMHTLGAGDSSGLDFYAQQGDLDFHHNLFSNFGSELPSMNSASMRWVNNLIYNWDQSASQVFGRGTVDFIGNRYKHGPLNSSTITHPIQACSASQGSFGGNPSLYVHDNVGPSDSAAPADQTTLVAQIPNDGQAEQGTPPSTWFRTAPMPDTYFDGGAGFIPIVADPSSTVESTLLADVGNSRGLDCAGNWVARRDAVDARVIAEYRDGGVGALFVPLSDGGYPIPPIPAAQGCATMMHDGIPDLYAAAHGLDPADGTKGTRDAGNGYTWLDRYLDGF